MQEYSHVSGLNPSRTKLRAVVALNIFLQVIIVIQSLFIDAAKPCFFFSFHVLPFFVFVLKTRLIGFFLSENNDDY